MVNPGLVIVATTAILLSGCVQPPSIVVFGAGFPDWLFCIIGGLLGTTFVHLLLSKLELRQRFSPLALSYCCMVALFSMLIWLFVFSH